LVGFNLVKGIGPARLKALIDHFGDAKTAWNATASALGASGLNPKLVESILQTRKSGALEKTWQRIKSLDIGVLTWEDSEYPRRLKEIDQSPPVLYMRGKILEEDQFAVAVVGTRRSTAYGRQITEELVRTLVANGITVVSGLARGIDGVAHKNTIIAGGRTLAVLGSGVDRIYPPEHRQLADEIAQNGAVLSDYPPGTAPEGGNFPPRNRIISGLSQVVVVIEAGKRSGALITAAFAAEHGRDVFAVPGNMFAPQSKGTNVLIREGAQIMLDPQDVLEVLNLANIGKQRSARSVLPADATEAQLYNLLDREPLHVDEIRARSELPIEQVSATLTLMELKGMVRQVGSMQYIAVYERGEPYEVNEK